MEVTAAVIHKDNKILICQRPEGKVCGLMWEFPGGKVEKGESYEQCVKRECMEELGISIDVVGRVAEIVHKYDEFTVDIHFFDCIISRGAICKKEHKDIRWIGEGDVDKYKFCPADDKVIEFLEFK